MEPAVLYHENLASRWEDKYRRTSFAMRQKVLADCLADVSLAGQKWLDAGCGTGTLARWLARRGCSVRAVDASPAMVSVASSEALEVEAGAISLARVDSIERLPDKDACYDGILCSSVLEYLEHPRECLATFARLLKPRGLLVISVPNQWSLLRRALVATHRLSRLLGPRPVAAYLQHSKNEYSAKSFSQLLKDNNLSSRKYCFFGGSLPPWLMRRSWVGSLIMFVAVKD